MFDCAESYILLFSLQSSVVAHFARSDTYITNIHYTKALRKGAHSINMTGQMAGQINERGYPKLAGLMATSSEAAIFRQFRQLQMINLLRLQATLQDLENEYRDIRAKDSVYLSRSNLVDSFRLVRESAERGDDDESKHHDILVRIGKCLKKYSRETDVPHILTRLTSSTRRSTDPSHGGQPSPETQNTGHQRPRRMAYQAVYGK